jgi:hypothetical protein
VVDVTSIVDSCPSYCRQERSKLDSQRIKTKHAMYGAAAADRKEKLLAAVVFHSGFLGREALQACREASTATRGFASPHECQRALRRAALEGHARCLLAAEHRAGVSHRTVSEGPPPSSDSSPPPSTWDPMTEPRDATEAIETTADSLRSPDQPATAAPLVTDRRQLAPTARPGNSTPGRCAAARSCWSPTFTSTWPRGLGSRRGCSWR